MSLEGGTESSSPSFNRNRNRSLRKSAAVEEEVDPIRDYNEVGMSSSLHQSVPRLLLPPPVDQSSSSLQHLLPNVSVDTNLLIVPSPGSAYKLSPDSSRQTSTDLPSTADLLTMNFPQNLMSNLLSHSNGLNLLGQLTQDRKMDSGETDDSALSPNPSFDLSNQSFKCTDQSLLVQSSTESQSSIMSSQNPNKSIIQEEVRAGGGRFQLKRKKGRSEVWNLFGQVVDTYTGQRLPYVACYACKVLYTDTGGGTGNMTRHRCPLGSSFRSVTGSSTERNNSFDSYRSTRRSASPESKRPRDMHMNSIEEVSGGLSPCTTLQSQPSSDSLSEEDKESLAEYALRSCVLDLLHPATFSAPGFLHLASQLLKIGRRRSCPELFPDVSTMTQNIEFMHRSLKERSEMEMMEMMEVTLSIQQLNLHGLQYIVYLHRMESDWTLKKTVIGVYSSSQVNEYREALDNILKEYRIPNEKIIRVVVPSKSIIDHPICKIYPDIVQVITTLVEEVMSLSSIGSMMKTLENITTLFSSHDLLPFITPDWKDLNNIVRYYRMTSGWNNHKILIGEAVGHTQNVDLSESLKCIDWNLVEACSSFFLPFYEAINSISNAHLPIATIIPEWFALLSVFEYEGSCTLSEERKKVAHLLRSSMNELFTMEYKMAVVLNPKVNRKLSLLFSESEKEEIFNVIRDKCGLNRHDNSSMDTSDGLNDISRKRFLESLEDISNDDELEAFIRGNCPSDRSIISFWNTTSRSKYPRLSQLARSILSIPATSPSTFIDRRVASLSPEHVSSFLILRSTYHNESNHI